MKYEDIYDLDFLKKFGKYMDKIKELRLKSEYEINVEKIANICEISIDNVASEHSGWSINNESGYSEEKNEIKINMLEPEYRRRFTIAHEIGHIILGHRGISYRSDVKGYENIIERVNEIAANNFAAELIMPKLLVNKALLQSMTDLGYKKTQLFDDYEFDILIKTTAKKLNVSRQALKYRVKNLRMFTDEK